MKLLFNLVSLVVYISVCALLQFAWKAGLEWCRENLFCADHPTLCSLDGGVDSARSLLGSGHSFSLSVYGD